MNSAKFARAVFRSFDYRRASALLCSFGMFYYYHKSNILMCRNKEALKHLNKTVECYEEMDPDYLEKKYPNLTVVRSNAFKALLTIIREKTVPTSEFRKYSKRLIRILLEEALALHCKDDIIKESPCGYYKGKINELGQEDYIAVSILRSGDAMLDELLNIMPDVRVGKILVQRNEESSIKEAIYFFQKLPNNINEKKVILVDPMIATGGSAIASIEILLKKGIKEENILFVNIISCEDGLKNLFMRYPKIHIITGSCDPAILPIKYIAPGLGDFGDRYYGTH